MAAMAWGFEAVGRIDPGKITVFVSAAGRIIIGIARKQKGDNCTDPYECAAFFCVENKCGDATAALAAVIAS